MTAQGLHSIATELRGLASDVLQKCKEAAEGLSAIRSREIWYATEAISASTSAEGR